MDEIEYTEAETKRQDYVDNAIMDLILRLAPRKSEIDWTIEYISDVREVIKDILVNCEEVMTEQEFYPFRGSGMWTDDSDKKNVELIILTNAQIEKAVEKELSNFDTLDELAEFAGDILGGYCWYNGDGTFSFEFNENYRGALDFIKGEN